MSQEVEVMKWGVISNQQSRKLEDKNMVLINDDNKNGNDDEEALKTTKSKFKFKFRKNMKK